MYVYSTLLDYFVFQFSPYIYIYIWRKLKNKVIQKW